MSGSSVFSLLDGMLYIIGYLVITFFTALNSPIQNHYTYKEYKYYNAIYISKVKIRKYDIKKEL